MKKATTNLPASVRQRLLNLATESKRDFGLVLTQYALERLLYRLSISPHREALVLKGALLLQLWTSDVYRPTRDLDLLGLGEGSVERYRKVFAELCSQKVEDDGLSFLADRIRVERIRDEEEYEGVRVLLEARLANARIPLQIDVGFGDIISPLYRLLDKHVEHTVKIVGVVSNATAHGMKDTKEEMKEHGMDKNSTEHSHMTVTDLIMVSATCQK